MSRTVVVANTAVQYKEWCWKQGITVHDAIFATPDRVRGLTLRPDDIVWLPGWTRRSEAEEIHRNIQLCLLAGESRTA